MQNLLQFLFRNGVFLLFVGLEVLCFYMVVQANERQAEIYHKSADLFTGALNKQVSSFADYWNLGEVNDSLRRENAMLRSRLANLKEPAPASTAPVDTVYEIIPARVIKNSIQSRNNYITLEGGSNIGSERGMGVISPDGPVGVVISTTKRYSKVLSLLHANTMISAAVKNKGYFGSLVWRGFNPTIMQLDAIPKHAPLETGDTIVTSGYSQTFPHGLQIGVVDTFTLERGSNFYSIDVRLDVDLSNIQSVYLIRNRRASEVDSLTMSDDDE